MPRKNRPLDRESGVVRDASLVVIATEDTHAVEQYFRRLKATRVQFKVIPTTDGRSNPKAVMDRLDEFRAEVATEEHDEFWICIDKDHWASGGHLANLLEVLRHCRKKGYGVAISNPCFELWLLLHFLEPDATSMQSCAEICKLLAEINGGYNKAKCCGLLPLMPEMVRSASERAARLDSAEEIPDSPVTRVYQILDTLLRRESIQLMQ